MCSLKQTILYTLYIALKNKNLKIYDMIRISNNQLLKSNKKITYYDLLLYKISLTFLIKKLVKVLK